MNEIDRVHFAALLEHSNIKLRLKRELRFVPEEVQYWQDRDFLAVMNRSHSEGVLMVSLDEITLLPFRLQRRKPNADGRVSAILCDLCMTWQPGSNSALITFDRQRSSLSFLCCADLDCSLHVRDKTNVAARSRVQLRETLSPQARVARLQQKLARIVDQYYAKNK